MRLFHVASDDEIKNGETTDIYFKRTKEVLEKKKLDKVKVIAEVTVSHLPNEWPSAVLCGIEEEAHLIDGYPINVYTMPEGTVFRPSDPEGVRVPVMVIEGEYGKFAVLETALLGLVCQATGIATKAARVKMAAGAKQVLGFGLRRMHPAMSLMIDRASYIGGIDGVSGVASAKFIGIKPSGTMPHALIVAFGDQVKAWKAFDEIMPPEVPRVALIDTYYDEKMEAVMVADALKERLAGVRLDTPGSRKGNFAEIVREVRWELDIRGYEHVKIYVSGGLDEEAVKTLGEAGADAFGVGTSISSAPTVDFALDIVELEGRPVAKRGKFGGRKTVWRCPKHLVDRVLPAGEDKPVCPICNGETEPILKPLILDGKIVAELPKPEKIRSYVLDQMKKL